MINFGKLMYILTGSILILCLCLSLSLERDYIVDNYEFDLNQYRPSSKTNDSQRSHRSFYLAHQIKKEKVQSRKTSSLEFPSLCPSRCFNMINCKLSSCRKCQVHCWGKCKYDTFTEQKGNLQSILINEPSQSAGECKHWCLNNPDKFCSYEVCKGCKFCQGQTCDIAKFQDVTSQKFSNGDSYWYKWKHSGKPYANEGAPLFVDLNDDGILDYFNSMHGHGLLNGETYADRMELAVSLPIENSNNEDNGISTRLKEVSHRIITEDKKFPSIDTHGQNILDLDNDGVLDILISSGGYNGVDIKPEYWSSRDNFLFWGKLSVDKDTGEKLTTFHGGRDAAVNANVHMRMGRGRINYVFDANGDGLIDIFSFHDRPSSNLLKPGVLLINQGDRTWKEDPSMSEYTRSIILTDADGDGIAEEILLSRGFCYPQREGPGTDPNYPDLGPFPHDVIEFCKTRPVGSIAVYKWSKSQNKMIEISPKYTDALPYTKLQPACCKHGYDSTANNCHIRSIVSGYLDNDKIVDHVYLYKSKMVFYFSTERPKNTLPIFPQHSSKEIYFPSHCISALTIRLIDFNNDGKQELFVTCERNGVYLLYSQGKSKKDFKINNNDCNEHGALYPLGNMEESSFTQQDLKDSCKQNSKKWLFLEKLCKYSKGVGKEIIAETAGISTVDLNNDGFVDIVASYHSGLTKFYHNKPTEAARDNHFIAFKLQGKGDRRGNKYGIGATLTLNYRLKGKLTWQKREISSYQHTTDKFGHQDDRIIFGLGSPEHVKVLYAQVKWQNRKVTKKWLSKWNFSRTLKPIILRQW